MLQDDSELWATRYPLTELLGGGGPPAEWDVLLPLSVPHQEQTNWCWAATSDGVAHYYDACASWTQCDIANAALSRSDCCETEGGGACDTSWYLDRALGIVGHFARVAPEAAPLPDVEGELKATRPLGLRVGWSGGGGHFLAIGGCLEREQRLHVEDPWYGPSDVLYSALESSYQGSGTWTHTYWTSEVANATRSPRATR